MKICRKSRCLVDCSFRRGNSSEKRKERKEKRNIEQWYRSTDPDAKIFTPLTFPKRKTGKRLVLILHTFVRAIERKPNYSTDNSKHNRLINSLLFSFFQSISIVFPFCFFSLNPNIEYFSTEWSIGRDWMSNDRKQSMQLHTHANDFNSFNMVLRPLNKQSNVYDVTSIN